MPVLIIATVIAAIAAWFVLSPLMSDTAVSGSKNFGSLGHAMEQYTNNEYGFKLQFPAATPVFVSLSTATDIAIDTFAKPGSNIPPLAIIITPTDATATMPTVFRLSPQTCQSSSGKSLCTLLADNGRVKLILGDVPQDQYATYQSEFQQIVTSFTRT